MSSTQDRNTNIETITVKINGETVLTDTSKC